MHKSCVCLCVCVCIEHVDSRIWVEVITVCMCVCKVYYLHFALSLYHVSSQPVLHLFRLSSIYSPVSLSVNPSLSHPQLLLQKHHCLTASSSTCLTVRRKVLVKCYLLLHTGLVVGSIWSMRKEVLAIHP